MEPVLTENDVRESTRPMDDEGRIVIAFMSREEKIDEILATIRATHDLVNKFLTDFAEKGPMGMLSAFTGMGRR